MTTIGQENTPEQQASMDAHAVAVQAIQTEVFAIFRTDPAAVLKLLPTYALPLSLLHQYLDSQIYDLEYWLWRVGAPLGYCKHVDDGGLWVPSEAEYLTYVDWFEGTTGYPLLTPEQTADIDLFGSSYRTMRTVYQDMAAAHRARVHNPHFVSEWNKPWRETMAANKAIADVNANSGLGPNTRG